MSPIHTVSPLYLGSFPLLFHFHLTSIKHKNISQLIYTSGQLGSSQSNLRKVIVHKRVQRTRQGYPMLPSLTPFYFLSCSFSFSFFFIVFWFLLTQRYIHIFRRCATVPTRARGCRACAPHAAQAGGTLPLRVLLVVHLIQEDLPRTRRPPRRRGA